MSLSSQSDTAGTSFPDSISLLHVPSQKLTTSRDQNTITAITAESTTTTSDSPNVSQSPTNPLDGFYALFYTSLSHFSFDKAKEIVDKQQREFTVKHQQQLHGHYGPTNASTPSTVVNFNNWLILMTSMGHLVILSPENIPFIISHLIFLYFMYSFADIHLWKAGEKNYMNLTFLAPKGFLRKDSNLKSSMTFIKTELKKLSEPKTEDQVQLRDEILVLVGIRLDLMDFYEKLSLLGTAKNVEIIDLLSDVEVIVDKYNEESRNSRPPAQAIFRSMGWEIEIVTSLLKAHASIQNWEFLPSLISMQDANKQLTEWSNYLQLKESSKKSTFYNFPPAMPILYQWIWKLKATLLSKFSAYFYEVLAKNSNETYNIRFYCTKLHSDLYYRLTSFQKKSDALAVCLVFDARETSFHPGGYHHPSRTITSPQGIDSFPAILAIPSKPAGHWPSVVMIISDRLQSLNLDKFIGFYDTRVQATYFIMRVDVKIYMLTIFESKKSEKDSYVSKFMQELAIDLKCGKIFSSLKCGVK